MLEFAKILACCLSKSDQNWWLGSFQKLGGSLNLLHKEPTFHHFLQFYISTCLTKFAPVTTSFMPSEPNTYAVLANSMGLLTGGSHFRCDLWSGQTLFSKMDYIFFWDGGSIYICPTYCTYTFVVKYISI